MIIHATLVRVDPPGSAQPGDPIVVRSALTSLTRSDLDWLAVNGLSATAAVYVPLGAQTPDIEAGAVIAVQQDGLSTTEWIAVHAADYVGVVSRYRKVYVTPA